MKKPLSSIAFISVIFFYCTVLIIFFSGYLQAQQMATRVYTAKDGLPSTYTFNAYQDKLGYLWVGTPDGLSRFDGKNFTNYGLSNGLPDIKVRSQFMDSRLRLWGATARGAYQFNEKRIVNYPLSDSQNIHYVSRILETTEGRIWSLTNVGVYEFDLNKWNKIKLYPGYENHSCIGIVETKEGLYVNYGNLLILKTPSGKYKIIGIFKDESYYYNDLSLYQGQIFISTLEGLYEIINQEVIKLPGELGKLKGLYIYFRDSKKRFWIGRYKVGIKLITAGDSKHFIPVYNHPPDFLPQGISEDMQGNIWVASGDGLIRISDMGFKIFDLSKIIGKTMLRNVIQTPTSAMFINNGSLTITNFENNVFKEKKLQTKSKTLLPNNELIIDNYAFDDEGRYWYYLRGFALAMQDGDKVYEQSNQLAHLGDQVFDVLFDRCRKKIMVAVRTQKFPCLLNDTSYSILPVANDIAIKGEIMHLHQCANGTVLFTTDRGLIYSIDKQNNCKLQLNEFGASGQISKLYNDPNGDVWILYNGRGLRHYSWQKEQLILTEQITKMNGLINDNVSAMCFDNSNNLWVCTNSSVTVFSKNSNPSENQAYQLVSFFDAEDLQIGDSYDTKIMKDMKGDIWLFSGQHLICFYPDKIKYTLPIPSIAIENLELNLRQTNWADYVDSLSGIFQLPYNLQLSHDNNTLGIYFKGISSSGTEGIKYSYFLEGLENLWSPPATNDFVSFVRLPPGKYIFKVKAQLANTRWSPPAIFSFEIKKAFWQTWWFYILIGVGFSFGIYMFFRYRLTQKINLLEIRNRFSQDLHDDIGASVSGINLLSQMAAEKLQNNKPGEAADYLLKVKNYTQDVIEKLSDMVWIFNPQNDSIEKLLQRLKSFSISIALSKNIKMHFATGKESKAINLSIHQRKAIYLISKEAINNIFKYAECNNIYYSLTVNNSKWRLRIQDDGKGFKQTETRYGNGVKNMQARATEIKAKFTIQSEPGNGTIVTVEL